MTALEEDLNAMLLCSPAFVVLQQSLLNDSFHLGVAFVHRLPPHFVTFHASTVAVRSDGGGNS